MQREVKQIIAARPALVGGIQIMRALPSRELRRVGSFVFLDHFDTEGSKAALHVEPHPHLGLETVTYLFDGQVRHTDSLGTDQWIKPGDVNWMTAGSGIVHAEDTGPEAIALHGIQTWVGLPAAHRKIAPAFRHYPASALPNATFDGAQVRVIAGNLTAHQGTPHSPVHTYRPMTYFDIALSAGARLSLNVEPSHELALYTCTNSLKINKTKVPARSLAELSLGGEELTLDAELEARAILIGGVPLPEPTVVYWNFVVDSTAEGRVHEKDWQHGLFPKIP